MTFCLITEAFAFELLAGNSTERHKPKSIHEHHPDDPQKLLLLLSQERPSSIQHLVKISGCEINHRHTLIFFCSQPLNDAVARHHTSID
jgi:hypothetical protein